MSTILEFNTSVIHTKDRINFGAGYQFKTKYRCLCINNTMKLTYCQSCNTSFIPKAGTFGKFCSLSCSSRFNNKLATEKKISKYSIAPALCTCCTTSLPYEKRKNKFCSISCSTTFNNVKKDYTKFKPGPVPKEKLLFCPIKFNLCKHTNKWYSNKNPDGTIRRCSPYIKTIKEQYYNEARFKFNVYHYPNEFDLFLIEQHGWYTCPGLKRKGHLKNINGVSRDHIISVSYGFANNIDPKIIAHPANCRIMIHLDNKIKHGNCALTLHQLLEKITTWDQKYSERRIGLEPMTFSLEN